MEKSLDSGCGCGCDNHGNKEPAGGLQSTGVSIMSKMDDAQAGCGTESMNPLADHEKPGYILNSFVEDFILTDTGPVPKVKTKMDKSDIKATIWVRTGIGRDNYKVAPGLYCVGNPDKTSEVLVTKARAGKYECLDSCFGYQRCECLVRCRERNIFH